MTDAAFWDTRFAPTAHVYGTAPNTFLAQEAHRLVGPVLSLGEGEGRNGVFLAGMGLRVLGVDFSEVALAKARQLAQAKAVRLDLLQADLATFEPPPGSFGGVVSIFAHLPSPLRAALVPRIERCLVPGGLLLLEGYALDQLARDTGGPRDPDLLLTLEGLRQEWSGLEPLLLRQVDRDIQEGQGHSGLSTVIQFVGRKRGTGA